MVTGFDAPTMLGSDPIHPNSSGYKVQANHWYSVMGPHLPQVIAQGPAFSDGGTPGAPPLILHATGVSLMSQMRNKVLSGLVVSVALLAGTPVQAASLQKVNDWGPSGEPAKARNSSS